jgi:hypothetical protein
VLVCIDDGPVFSLIWQCHSSLLNSQLRLACRPEVGSCDDANDNADILGR